jgi:glycine/D-amino acid oxidase-like deaminating enzyme
LRQDDPVAFFALREHARDAGFPLGRSTLATLRRFGLAGSGGVPGPTRAIVADVAKGYGLSLQIEGLGGGRTPAGARDGVVASVQAHLRAKQFDAAAAALLAHATTLVRSTVAGEAMLPWVAAAATLVDRHGAALPQLQRLVTESQRVFDGNLSRQAEALFFDLAAMTGATLEGGPTLPLRRVPYWQKEAHPLEGFQSTKALPKHADVVIIGAGLTGGAAALHLADGARRRGWRVVLLEATEVASQASGRNGGNLEAIPENFFGAYGTYDGYVQERYKFLKAAYPDVGEDVLQAQARRIAETVIRFAGKNATLLTDDIRRERFEADLSLGGWLRLALNRREEKALLQEVEFGKRLGVDMRAISPADIKRRFGLRSKYYGRLVAGNGNFHPFKFVVQEVQRAVEKGVLLYTHTKVEAIASKARDEHHIRTTRGTIKARRVIVAVNAFTSQIFPQLRDIQPFRSQIVNYTHVRNDLNGITFTAKDGDIYGNFPKQDWYRSQDGVRRGTLHLGGGLDTPFTGPEHARPSTKVYRLIQQEGGDVFADLAGKVPIRTWAGPMAFVEGKHGQRMAVIGELGDGAERGVLIAVWCNGYGGTGCHKTGAEAAHWALRGKLSADVPEDVFGVKRLLSDEPMFDVRRGGPNTGRRAARATASAGGRRVAGAASRRRQR